MGRSGERNPKSNSHENLEKLVLLLVSGMSRESTLATAQDKLGLKPAAAKRLLDEAETRIALAARFDRAEQLGTAINRLTECYRRSLANQDVKTCVLVQRELNRLMDLYRPSDLSAAADPGQAGEPQAVEELSAARAHLAALKLGRETDPLPELCRLAVERIVELEARADE